MCKSHANELCKFLGDNFFYPGYGNSCKGKKAVCKGHQFPVASRCLTRLSLSVAPFYLLWKQAQRDTVTFLWSHSTTAPTQSNEITLGVLSNL
jgi:hypothetical protein